MASAAWGISPEDPQPSQSQKGRPAILLPFETQHDIENEADIVYAAERLPGTSNLQEKSIPVVRFFSDNPVGPQGIKNLEEHSQISLNDEVDTPPAKGRLNLHEKVQLTASEIARSHPQLFVNQQQTDQ
ncbi:hypothetical protein QAD02_014990 [Eretmocerus hayati]|uniref:Uncharacterized protein n=1 Tax=Eretmocerus hayati TaxID=131215 RepID=A0ACC2P7W5_9HYME|nr:hypothetical protein QAD02_014990 [Eretmocerus hayati]